MFACLYALSAPIAALIELAEEFTPRFEVVGPLVMLDVSGLSRLLGSPQEIGEQLRRSSRGPLRIALAPTQTAAALLAMGRPGLTVVLPGEQPVALAPLPVSVLADFDRQRLVSGASLAGGTRPRPTPWTSSTPTDVASSLHHAAGAPDRSAPAAATDSRRQPATPPSVSPFADALPYFQHSVAERGPEVAVHAHCGGGWMHPRDTHVANHPRRARRAVTASRDVEHAPAATTSVPVAPLDSAPEHAAPARTLAAPGATHAPPAAARVAPAQKSVLATIQSLQDTLRRWGVRTLGALAALPSGEVYERLGARGVLWQRLARGEDAHPMVPWVPEDPFETSLDLEWPIEGLEPLSFVLGRLFEPLADRLERADRGAAILHTHLRLVNKVVHARTLQLPAPMRDPKTLRTLVLLDLEANPPSAAVDGVRVLVEPTPARVVQWALFERAQASPEQVSTLLARLTALMGDGHVGSPRLVDSWKPGAFEMQAFQSSLSTERSPLRTQPSTRNTDFVFAFRRFRLPVPARVQVHEGRPVRVQTDRRGITGGAVAGAAGPWRTSGEWWNDAPAHQADPTHPTSWDRDEWDIALPDGTLYRVYVERDAGQWFIEGTFD